MKNQDKKILLFVISTIVTSFGIGYTLLKGTSAISDVPPNESFNDMEFYRCVVEEYNNENDTNYDYATYSLTDEQLANISELNCGKVYVQDLKIKSTDGIEKMTSLAKLFLHNNEITSIDISKNILLEELRLDRNQLSYLDLTKNTLLKEIDASDNQLLDIDLTGLKALIKLDLDINKLSSLDVSDNTLLEELNVSENNLTGLNVKGLTSLKKIFIHNNYYGDVNKNQLTSLDVSDNVNLIELNATGNLFDSLDLSNNVKLTELYVSGRLTKLDVSKNVELTKLNVNNNQLTELDVSNNINLMLLYADNNQLTKIDVSNNILLEDLHLNNNKLVSLNVKGADALKTLEVDSQYYDMEYENQLTELDISQNVELIKLSLCRNELSNLDVSKNTKLTELNLSFNNLSAIDLSKNTLLEELNLYDNELIELNLDNNVKLINLDIINNLISELDLSNNNSLIKLYADNNKIENVIFSKDGKLEEVYLTSNKLTSFSCLNESLKSLYLSGNMINTIDLTSNINLRTLDLGYYYRYTSGISGTGYGGNKLENIDLSKNTGLEYLYIVNNLIKHIDLSKNTKLRLIQLSNNQLIDLVLPNTTGKFELDISNKILVGKELPFKNNIEKLVIDNENITSLDASNIGLTDILIKNAPLLTKLYIGNNKLTSLDLSENTVINELSIVNNEFGKNYYVYNGTQINMSGVVKLPSNINWGVPSWKSNDIKLAVVADDGLVNTLETGNVDIIGEVKNKYTITNKLEIVKIVSDKYIINEEKNYIFIGNNEEEDIIKNNIKVSNSDVVVDVDMENKKIYVKYDENILKSFDIINYSSLKYDLSNDYIYVGDEDFDLNKITVFNCTKEINNNRLLIKVDEVIIDEFELISISSDKYELDKDYIYIGNNKFDTNDINVFSSGTIKVESDKLLIKYNEDVLDEYELVSISSDNYNLDNEYIYVGFNDFNISNINDVNADLVLAGNRLLVKYNEEILDEYEIISIKFNNYEVVNKSILIENEINYGDFIDDITKSNGVTYKIFDTNGEVTSGVILKDMLFKVYYNKIEVDSYTIVNDYIEFDVNLKVDNNNMIIGNIEQGLTIDEMLDMIDTNGEIEPLDKNGEIVSDTLRKLKTGDRFKINLLSQTIIYSVSVKGDVNGDGDITKEDIQLSSKHIVNGSLINDDEYLQAIDYDNNNVININDIIKMVRRVKGV